MPFQLFRTRILYANRAVPTDLKGMNQQLKVCQYEHFLTLAGSPMEKKADRSVVVWLLSGCVLIALMVLIGGITRLTHSGLSIVEWDLIMGSVPPGDSAEWNAAFDLYKQIPEYQQENFNMSLEDFKSIYFWEYLHRMWGRMLGLVFILPFVFFVLRKRITGELLKKCLIILVGGALVGGLGWFMVLSGLKDKPDISHYRLAIHLIAAFSLCAFIFHTALEELYGGTKAVAVSNSIRRGLQTLFVLVLMQIVYGAFVAGLDAGFLYPSFPKMGDAWIADRVTELSPWWINFLEGKAGVQFIHRCLAYIVFGGVIWLWFKARKIKSHGIEMRAFHGLLGAVLIQFLLGVFTILGGVPISLALLHQMGALVLLLAVVYAGFGLRVADKTATG